MENDNFDETDNFTTTVLEYLKSQEPLKPEQDLIINDYDIELTSNDIVKSILDDLIQNFEKCERLKEEYEFNVINHNQYQLFDLRDIIKDFDIDDVLYNNLTYRETLVIGYSDKLYLLEPDPCGGCCLDIQRARGTEPLRRITPDVFKSDIYEKLMNVMHMDQDREIKSDEDVKYYTRDLSEYLEQDFTKFLVHFNCKFNVNGHDAGERITSWIDKNFHTIEESRTEFIDEDGIINTKKLYICLIEGKYFVKHYNSTDNIKECKYYSLQKMKRYVSEGANFLLMRYMAITRFVGPLEMSCAYINGDMCLNVYNCMGPESGVFNNTKLDVCRIYRSIIEECGLTHEVMSVLTLEGQILKQEWKNVSYTMYINPKAVVSNVKPEGNLRVLLEKDWRNDLQLYSEYLDTKMENKMHVSSYLADHTEIHNLLADYVQQILQIKPSNVIEFTINYFSTYAPKYFEKFKFNSFIWGHVNND